MKALQVPSRIWCLAISAGILEAAVVSIGDFRSTLDVTSISGLRTSPALAPVNTLRTEHRLYSV